MMMINPHVELKKKKKKELLAICFRFYRWRALKRPRRKLGFLKFQEGTRFDARVNVFNSRVTACNCSESEATRLRGDCRSPITV